MFFSGLMHWLVSQSLFLAKITVLDHNGVRDPNACVTSCGFSAIAIIFTIGVGSLMVLTVIATGFRRFRPGIPVAGSCSLAISAACHPPPDDVNASVLPVKWGVVRDDSDGMTHCTFTSQETHLPMAGHMYGATGPRNIEIKHGRGARDVKDERYARYRSLAMRLGEVYP